MCRVSQSRVRAQGRKSTLAPFLLSWAGRSEPDDLFEITNHLYCLYFYTTRVLMVRPTHDAHPSGDTILYAAL